ncbi:MAG: DUF6382 domain-containing protein [Lachnospiraceae bacterium]|nr:DUF6382 domain-containing protein [Lachnospiraceae bacterium]
MFQIETENELNKTYLKISGDVGDKTDDFRFRMLLSNCIDGIIPMQFRSINGEQELYFEITEKEPISKSFDSRIVGRDEIRELFGEIMKVVVSIERFLIDEGSLILSPEYIYRNLRTGRFEFICIPDTGEERRGNETLVELMSFLTGKADAADEKLTEALYGLYDMAVLSNVSLATMYEVLMSELREIKPVEETKPEIITIKEDTDMDKKKKKFYIPSWKELGAVAMCLGGLAIVGTNLFSFLVR